METVETFLTLVRLGIGNHAGKLPQKVDWSAVQELATKQGLYAVVLDGIERLKSSKVQGIQGPPQETMLEWIGEVLHEYEYRYEQYCKAISELAGFYNSHGFKMMVLKGYACSLDWPKPNHRPCGDIDIWQFGKQKEADALIESLELKVGRIKVDKSHHHHTVFNWGDFMVENHFDFINVYARKSNRELEGIFKELGADDSHWVEVNGERAYLPSPNLHALFLMRHAIAHFSSTSITLRLILDWAFFVKKHNKEIDWGWLISILEENHFLDFFNCINAICVEELGFEANIFHGVQFNPALKDRIFKDIIKPEYTAEEPKYLIPRLVYKYRRCKGNGWKHELCFNESMLSAFWSGVCSHILKPASI